MALQTIFDNPWPPRLAGVARRSTPSRGPSRAEQGHVLLSVEATSPASAKPTSKALTSTCATIPAAWVSEAVNVGLLGSLKDGVIVVPHHGLRRSRAGVPRLRRGRRPRKTP